MPPKQIVVNRAALQQSCIKHAAGDYAAPKPDPAESGEAVNSRFHALFDAAPAKPMPKGRGEKIEHRRFGLQLLSAFGFVVGLWFAMVFLMTGRPLQSIGLAIATVYITTRARSSCVCSQCRGSVHSQAQVCQHCKAEF